MEPAPSAEEVARALAAALAEVLPGPVRVERLERLTGGASRETWSLDACDASGERHALVLRRDFPERSDSDAAGDVGRPAELALTEALHAAGAPVPRPLGAPVAGHELGDCYLMERIEGESRPRAIVGKPELAVARVRLAADCGSALAGVHAIDPVLLPSLPTSGLDEQLALCRSMLDAGPALRPVLELALRWCHDRGPAPSREPRLVHGDFRNGNLIVGERGLRAIIDWEYAHLGEPLEDLGFLCMRPWRFGNDEAEVGGFGSRDDLYRAYAEVAGREVDPDAVRFWEVIGNLKWGALCALRGQEHVERRRRSVELAAIGRRVVECEYDLLELID